MKMQRRIVGSFVPKSRVAAALVGAVVVGAVILVMGVSFASIPDNVGVVHGCYKTSATPVNHPLSVIDSGKTASCPSGTAALNWSAVNIQQGAHDGSIILTSSSTTIGSLPLGPGNYALFAKVVVTDSSPSGGADDQCTLTAGGNVDTSIAGFMQGGTAQTLPLQVVATFGRGGTVNLACADVGGSGSQYVDFFKITSISGTTLSQRGI